MSTYSDASLIYYPSGYKAGTAYSLKPTDGSGDLTFTRASSATRVNEQGLIETASILGSELVTNGDFASDTNWIKQTSWSISGGAANYDFLSDSKYIRQTILNGGFVAGKTYRINFEVTSGSAYMNFNSNGGGLISINTYEVGSYSIYVSPSISASDLLIYGRNTSGTAFSIDNVSVKEVITNNVPRIDYTGGGCGKLLLEPQRTNLFDYSEDFSQWAANAGGILSIEPNYAISPEGVENAYKVNFVVQGDSDLALVDGHSVTGGSTYAYSIYIKGEGSDIGKDIVVKSKRSGGDSAGTITTQTLTGEWVRVDFTTTYAANNTATTFRISSNDATSCLIYGAQAELGSYSTSYIPTSGVAVTRLADTVSKSGISSLINSTEGVLYAEISALADDLTYRILSISDGTTAERIYMQYTNATNTVAVVIKNGSTTQANMNYALSDETELAKVAIKYKANDFALWVNGFEVGTDASGTTPTGLSELAFDDGGGGNYFYGNVQTLMVFPTVLSDDDLTLLTGTLGETYFESYALMANYLNYTIQ